MRSSIIIIIATLLIASCSKPFPEGDWIRALAVLRLMDFNKYIFVTAGTHNGNFATGFASGIAGADAFCQSDKLANFPNFPGNSTEYKALIVDDVIRRASNTSNTGDLQLDWVLKPNTQYFSSDGSLLMTTNSNSIFVGTLSTPLSSNASLKWWTGLDVDWVSSGLICAGALRWNGTGNGSVGVGAVTSSTAFGSASLNACSGQLRLLCVRQ